MVGRDRAEIRSARRRTLNAAVDRLVDFPKPFRVEARTAAVIRVTIIVMAVMARVVAVLMLMIVDSLFVLGRRLIPPH